jgi:hypothetical protein
LRARAALVVALAGSVAGCFNDLPDPGLYWCAADSDCPADYQCRDERCWPRSNQPDHCGDGSRDGDESDVDCGASCGATCAVDQSCGGDGDCVTGACLDGFCDLVSGPPYWLGGPQLRFPRQGATVVAHPDGRIFAMAGGDGMNTLGKTVDVLDTRNGSAWEMFDDLLNARRDAAGAVLDGKLYIAGGIGQERFLEAYDFGAKKWALLTNNIGFSVGDASFLSDGKQLGVFGGFDASGFVTGDAHTFTPTGGWPNLPAIKARRASGAAIGPDGRSYVLGGAGDTDTSHDTAAVQVLSMRPAAWQDGVPLPRALHNLGAVGAPDGRIYVIGGSAGDITVGEVWALRPGARAAAWRPVSALNEATSGAGAVLGFDGRIYAVGGGPQDLAKATKTVEIYGPVVQVASGALSGYNFAASAGVEVRDGSGAVIAHGQSDAQGMLKSITLPAAAAGTLTVMDVRSRYPVTVLVP